MGEGGMRLGHCEACKHWEPPLSVDHGPHGYCAAIRSDSDETCLAEMRGYDQSDFYTMPGFGCVKFEAKCA